MNPRHPSAKDVKARESADADNIHRQVILITFVMLKMARQLLLLHLVTVGKIEYQKIAIYLWSTSRLASI